MQTHGGAEAEEAIVSAERRFHIELWVDWNRDGQFTHELSNLSRYADNVSVDRSLSGSAPAEIMLIDGQAAAELEFTLGGEDSDLNFVSIFSPYNGLSPLYNLDPVGCEVKYRIGVETVLGVIWYSQFIGNVRDITPNRGSNAVTVTALDRVEALRIPVRFPTWAVSSYFLDRGYAEAQLCDSQWVIDHCLRQGNTSPTPYRPMYMTELEDYPQNGVNDAGPQFWLTGNGSHLPTVGTLDNARSQGFPKSEDTGGDMFHRAGLPHPDSPSPELAPYSLSALPTDTSGLNPATAGLNTANQLRYWARNRVSLASLALHYVGFTLNTTGPDGEYFRTNGVNLTLLEVYIGWRLKIVVSTMNGYIRGEVRNYDTTGGFVTDWTLVPDEDHVQVDIAFALAQNATFPNPRMYISVGSTPAPDVWVENNSSVPFNGIYDPNQGLVVVQHRAAMSDVYWYNRDFLGTNPPRFNLVWARRPAKYAAVLDRASNRLTFMPSPQAEDAWQVITEVAAAEMGSVFWDEDGVFRFWRLDTVLAKQADVVRTLSLDDVSGLQITQSLESVRNVLVAETTVKTADTGVVFDASEIDQFYLPGNGTTSIYTMYVNDVVAVNNEILTRYMRNDTGPFPQWSKDSVAPGYVLQFYIPAQGQWNENSAWGPGGVDLFSQLDENGNLRFRIYNGWAEPGRFAVGIGDDASPALRIGGTLVYDKGTASISRRDATSAARYRERLLKLSGDWVQWSPEGHATLLDLLLPRVSAPIPTTDNIEIAGDPRLQLGDTIRITDPDGLGEEMKLQILGIRRTYSRDSGLTDILSVELIRPPKVGIWDSPQYGRWDQTFLWS